MCGGTEMIKASELRQKYFADDSFNDSTFEQLKTLCEKSIIAAAEKGEDSLTINIPTMYKKRIAEWLEDNEYTVFGVNSDSDEMYIFWSEDLVQQMV
jgi:hypothetical protein